MYLLIDAGNTRIKYAGYDGRDWLFHEAHAYDDCDGQDFTLPAALSARIDTVEAWVVSVAGAARNAGIAEALSRRAVSNVRWFESSASAGGLLNAYTAPGQLGADRWAAAIGAWHRVLDACIVVCAGTATTVDVVSAKGVFEGGCILPGVDMMRSALAGGTAGLQYTDGKFEAVPRNTADAIISGCLNAQIGAVERMRAYLSDAAPVVLAGGAAPALREHLSAPIVWAPQIVLEGLSRVAMGRA